MKVANDKAAIAAVAVTKKAVSEICLSLGTGLCKKRSLAGWDLVAGTDTGGVGLGGGVSVGAGASSPAS